MPSRNEDHSEKWYKLDSSIDDIERGLMDLKQSMHKINKKLKPDEITQSTVLSRLSVRPMVRLSSQKDYKILLLIFKAFFLLNRLSSVHENIHLISNIWFTFYKFERDDCNCEFFRNWFYYRFHEKND